MANFNISEANQAYQQQNYEKALELYQKIVDEGVNNFTLFYNLGNVYFKLGEIAKARLYYERAAKYEPLNSDLQHNLNLIKSNLKDEEISDKGIFNRLFFKIFYFLSINTLGILVLIFFIILMLLISGMIAYSKKEKKNILKILIIIISVFFVISIILTISRLIVFNKQSSAVIMDDTVLAYSGPNKNFQQVFTVHSGLKVEIEQRNENWMLIKLPSGLGGWIPRNSLERI